MKVKYDYINNKYTLLVPSNTPVNIQHAIRQNFKSINHLHWWNKVIVVAGEYIE